LRKISDLLELRYVRDDEERGPLKEYDFIGSTDVAEIVQLSLEKLNIGDQGVDDL
jgi:hypothetical protein